MASNGVVKAILRLLTDENTSVEAKRGAMWVLTHCSPHLDVELWRSADSFFLDLLLGLGKSVHAQLLCGVRCVLPSRHVPSVFQVAFDCQFNMLAGLHEVLKATSSSDLVVQSSSLQALVNITSFGSCQFALRFAHHLL